jgi:hypothetical protein
MSALDVARRNIEEFGNELWEKAKQAALARRNKIPPPADVLQNFAQECVGFLREFADRCSNQFSWADARELPPEEWKNGEGWAVHCETQMGFLHNRLGDFIEPLSREVGVSVSREMHVDQATKLLSAGHTEVLRKFKLELAHKVEESKSRSEAREAERKKQETERQQKATERTQDRADRWQVPLLCAVIAAMLTQAGNYAYSRLTGGQHPQANNCQSSSPTASSKPSPAPQTFGTPVPSIPPSADPPHVTQPAPATPSSAPRP